MPLFTQEKINPPKTLADRFIVPPFSVFNTHQPYFRDRVRMWNDLGLYTDKGRINTSYDNRRMKKYSEKIGQKHKGHSGISQFNPVVTEVMYKWFTPHKHSKILDIFAGGITRGGIAALLEHDYTGYDLNTEQISVNESIYNDLQNKYNIKGTASWINDDCIKVKELQSEYDMMLTCPPYFNLEKYTENEHDLSNCSTYNDFLTLYKDRLAIAYGKLKDDTFTVIVVSDVRDKKTTEYYPLVADTITICRNIGWKYYNEIILYNDTGNLAITSGDYMNLARKVGRQHQNILVFYKGNIKNIKDKFGSLDREES